MSLEEILMDPVVQGAIVTVAGTLALAVVGGFIKIIWSSINDRKIFNQLKDKIGNTEGSSLSKQHERIKETIVERANGIEKMQNNEFARIFNKVDSIDKEVVANKERYASLNLDQRDIRDNVNKLVNEWEHAIIENKELKNRIKELEIKNRELEKQYKDLSFQYRKEKSRENDIER